MSHIFIFAISKLEEEGKKVFLSFLLSKTCSSWVLKCFPVVHISALNILWLLSGRDATSALFPSELSSTGELLYFKYHT